MGFGLNSLFNPVQLSEVCQNKDMFTLIFTVLISNAEISGLDLLLNPTQRAGIEEYKRAVGIEVSGAQNSGFISYNIDLLESNSCFRSRSAAMYAELRNMTKTSRYTNNLNSKLPQGAFAPGFVWDMAMKHAANDPNLAMALIGVCGHDNTNQFGDDNFNMDIGNASGVYLASSHGVNCPDRSSPFFSPGSLGAEANITSQLQSRIGELQGNNGDSSFIPSKYYHVMGSAMSSCLLLRKGVPQAMAKTIVSTAVNAYRAGRICQDYLAHSQYFVHVSKGHSIDAGPILDDVLSGAIPINENLDFSSLSEEQQTVLNDLSIKEILRESAEIRNQKLERLLSFYNASLLLKKNPNIEKECSNPPKASMSLVNYLKSGEHKKSNVCPSDWRPARCQQAIHRLDTWAVDFEWTEAQHLAGFEFARKNCKPTYNDENALERSACSAQSSTSTLEVMDQQGVAR
jgi:hypothetical protein